MQDMFLVIIVYSFWFGFFKTWIFDKEDVMFSFLNALMFSLFGLVLSFMIIVTYELIF